MKKIFILIFFLAGIKNYSQNIHWVKTGGGTSAGASDEANTVVLDSNGNSYVGGGISTDKASDEALFDNVVLNHKGLSGADGFLAKYNNAGELSWIKSYGKLMSDFVLKDIALSPKEDFIVITGNYNNTTDIDGTSLVSAGGRDIFVAKIDLSGNLIWAKRFGSNNNESSEKVDIDSQGNIFIYGYYLNDIAFGSTTLTKQSNFNNRFITKLNSQGESVWAHRIGSVGKVSSDNKTEFGIAVDSQDNVILSGKVTADATYNQISYKITEGSHIFVAKFNNQGSATWVKTSTGIGNAITATALTVDKDDNIIIGGSGQYQKFFGSTAFLNNSIFCLTKLDKNGDTVWISDGAKIASGTTSASGYYGSPEAISTDAQGNIYACGVYAKDATFGIHKLNATTQGARMFAVKYNTIGEADWAIDFGNRVSSTGTIYEKAAGLSANAQGDVNIVGKFDQKDETFGALKASSAGGLDAYNLRISAKPLSTTSHNWVLNHKFYPNPVDNQIKISVVNPSESLISISSIEGKSLKTFSFSQEAELDVTFLQSGFYTYTITNTDGEVSTGKFIKK